MIPLSETESKKFVESLIIVQEYLHRINVEKGWTDPAPTPGECLANIHGEVSEINACLRSGKITESSHIPGFSDVEEEGADVVIYLSSWFHRMGWRLGPAILAKAVYNASRQKRHGGKVY